MKVSKAIFALAAFAIQSAASAQVPDAEAGPVSGAPSLAGAEDYGVPAPADRTVTLLDGVAFDLSVSDDESKASVQIGGFADEIAALADGARKTTFTWSAKLAVPVGGTDDLTSKSSLDALSDGSKLTVNLGWLGVRSAGQRLVGAPFKRIMLRAIDRCREKVRRKKLDDQAQEAALDACQQNPDPDFALEHSGYSEQAVNRTLFSSMWHVGLEASIGLKRFGHLDAATLDELQDTKLQYGAGFFAALYPSDAMTALIGKLEYQRAYEAADDAIVCKPVVVDPTEDCKKGAPTPATRTRNLNFSVELRRVLDSGWKPGSFAVAPKGTIDALSGDYELELPVYFIPRGDLPVAPGFQVSYSSEKEKFAFGLFLRSTFSF